ncbi:hypothetical protein KSP39_PZI006474 [Platanthera zijinensis]|uniref:Trichome birefringence-like N-terminal domain-containing protein n=1 Tax=Platanthera zijinensis TaxID=2320716 RepID=A0AAP0BSK5_9ASPA
MIGKAPTTAAAMDLRKHHYIDHYLATISSKRRFVLGVAASFFVVSLMASTICPAAASSSPASLFSWFFSVSGRFSFHRSNDSATASSYVGNSTPSSSSLADSGNGTSATETLKENYSRSDSDRGSVKIHQCSPVNSSSSNPDEIKKTQTLFGKTEAASRPPEVKKSVPANYTDTSQNFSARKNNETKDSMRTKGVYLKKCDIYDGRWVRDVTKPHYPPGSCPYIDGDFDCFKNGRPDDEYLRWRWQPHGCNIPRFPIVMVSSEFSNFLLASTIFAFLWGLQTSPGRTPKGPLTTAFGWLPGLVPTDLLLLSPLLLELAARDSAYGVPRARYLLC